MTERPAITVYLPETAYEALTVDADTGDVEVPAERIKAYATTDSPEYKAMVAEIARRLNLDSLKFSKLETIVEAIGLEKCQICTHCFDGSSYCHEHDKEDDRQLKLDF